MTDQQLHEAAQKFADDHESWVPDEQSKGAMYNAFLAGYAEGQGVVRWVRADRQLGEFKDSEIPDWKYFSPVVCKVDWKIINQGWFRKDTTKDKVVFQYYPSRNHLTTTEIRDIHFNRVEWYDESGEYPTTQSPEEEAIRNINGRKPPKACNLEAYCNYPKCSCNYDLHPPICKHCKSSFTDCECGSWEAVYQNENNAEPVSPIQQQLNADAETISLLSRQVLRLKRENKGLEEQLHAIEEGSAQWKQEYDNCRKILASLVELKDLKDTQGKTAVYELRQPLTWQQAKDFLLKYQHL